MAFGDAQVSYLGAEIMARAYNASNVGPQVRSIYGVPGKLEVDCNIIIYDLFND